MMLSIKFKHIILIMKQKNLKLVWLIIAVMVLAFVPKDAEAEVKDYTIAETDKPGGSGAPETPYEIATVGNLYWFAALVNGTLANVDQTACAILMNDITVNEDLLTKINTDDGTINGEVTDDVYEWTPIGTLGKPFLGTFDGKGYTIKGLYISSGTYKGLFGYCGKKENDIIYPCTIKNVGVVGSYIKGVSYIGGVCGTIDYGTIENCYNTGIVIGESYVGGVCGCVYDTSCTISNCYNTGVVTSTEKDYASVGGVCGRNWGTIENCYNTGDVSATGNYADVGGVCGNNASGGIIQYKRTGLTAATPYGTICMPYAVTAGKIVGAEFYSIAGKEEKEDGTVTSVYLEKVTGDLVAGQPYIFKATAETLTCTITSTSGEAEKAGKHNGLIGCFEETEVLEGDNIYVLKNNELYKRGTQPWKIAAGRAYIDLSQIATPSSAPAKGVIKMGVSGDGTTGIGAVTAEHDNVYYNLQGQRVAAPTRGIYIVNGKKVIIK